MLKPKIFFRIVSLLALIAFASACTPSQTPVLSTATQAAVEPVSASATPEAAAQPTDLPAAAESPAALAEKGFVLFNQEKNEFQTYAPDGSLLSTSPAPGTKYPPSYFSLSIVNEAIYYKLDRNAAENQEPQLLRTSPEGAEKVISVPSENIAASAVSPDEAWLAWSTLGPAEPVSEMFITNLKTGEQRKVARYTFDQGQAFFLRPFAWTADGKLLFERALTGIGGYILYGGHNSLYTYDPVSGEINTLVPAEEEHGLCLDSYHPAQDTVIFNCGPESHEIVIRSLNDSSQKSIPALPGQGVAGSARYSPSGKWLAYAIAVNNPDNESGQVVVIPADLSTPPAGIIEVAENTFPVVQGWLDEDTILFTRNQGVMGSVWTVKRDGSELKQIASGLWMGWLP